ncbi:hypothetical protein ACSVHC_16025 [Arthrobacter sp. KNU-44]|uniref:hypothetical protein n=1 Tax=unclassified Arthrobacter TaxID=235627 RepID=UPI003F41C9EB
MGDQHMRTELFKIFLGEIHHQSLLVIMATQDLDYHLGAHFDDPDRRTPLSPDRVWYSLSSALNGMISIANICWPTKDTTSKDGKKPDSRRIAAEIRASEIRRTLVLPEHGLKAVREVRNALVHFDEKLDKFAREGPAAFIGNLLGPAWLIGGDNFVIARHYDPQTSQLSVFGKELHLHEALSQTIDLQRRVLDYRDEYGNPVVGR